MSTIIGHDILHNVFLHFLLHIVVFNHTEGQRQQVSGHGIVTVEGAVGIEDMTRNGGRAFLHVEEFAVEGILGQHGFIVEILRISLESLHTGKVGHHPINLIIISGGDERAIGDTCGILTVDKFLLFRGNTPVSIFVARHQSVLLILVFQVFEPTLHVGIELAHGLVVAVLANHHIESHRQGSRPSHVVGIVVPESRSHIGDAAVFTLCLGDVAHPFGVKRIVVKEECFTETSTGAVAKPWLTLITLRTIHRESFIVGQNAPIGIVENLLQNGIGGFERACSGNGVGDYLDDKIFENWTVSQTCNFGITASVIDEGGMPPKVVFLAVGDIGVGAVGMAEILAPEISCGVELLCITDVDDIARFRSFETNFQPTSHVLSEVHDEGITVLCHRFRLQRFHHFHVRTHGTAKCT